MQLSKSVALLIARLAGKAARLNGSGATSLPGRLLLRLRPEALRELSSCLPLGTVAISATNGKTTTTALLSEILARNEVRALSNRSGANMAGGIASTLLGAELNSSVNSAQIGLFEIDELWLAQVLDGLNPRIILLSNLLRDQLDRYGELEAIAESWVQALGTAAGRRARPILCADDPLVADLGSGREDALFFGLQDPTQALPALGHAADARHCRNCGGAYQFDLVFLGHLGHYSCPACGHGRPKPSVFADAIHLDGTRGASFILHTPAGSTRIELPLPGLYNVYNALAACAAAYSLELPLARTAQALANIRPAFGRAERVFYEDVQLTIMLIKNPVGATEVMRTLAGEHNRLDLLIALNDNIADGRDTSWIWDADFELLAGTAGKITCTGTRAEELALRLKYAGLPASSLRVQASLPAALSAAVQSARAGAGVLYVLPTYTAMLDLRKLLGRGGRRLGSGA